FCLYLNIINHFQVSARFFSLYVSLPSSPDHSSFSICINQIGADHCSLLSMEKLAVDGKEMDVDFVSNTTRSSIQQHISFTTSIISSDFTHPLRRHSSLRLSLNQSKPIWIAPGLEMNVTLNCQQYYFGAACSLRCVSSPHTFCDSTGSLTCAEGWMGDDC
ncbi:hypothetical protein PENTCL1PPCAC_17044, partial [Pristionchus entomophagus]